MTSRGLQDAIERLKIEFVVLQDRMLKLECACVQAENEMKKLVER